MWRSIWNAITSFGQKKGSVEPSRASNEFSDDDDDDEIYSNEGADEDLECPICWESFNIVENVPYVLWCGHTICKNCLLGLKWAGQQIQVPLFVSCPWCNLLTLRLLYRGNLRFLQKNFFLLWMVESRNGDRVSSHFCTDRHNPHPPLHTSAARTSAFDCVDNGARLDNRGGPRRVQFSLHKSLDFFIRFSSKLPLVVMLVFLVILAIPSSAAIFVVYLGITIIVALPAFLVLYFAYPALHWLVREITS